MSEKTMRGRTVRGLRLLHAIAVENPVGAGTPDVNCSLGWLELKWIRRWPRIPRTIVRVDHFNQNQRLWLRKRWANCQGAWLLLQVGQEYLLFDGDVASWTVGKVGRQSLIDAATHYWKKGMNYEELRECLKPSHLREASYSSLTVEDVAKLRENLPVGFSLG
jgi:hypothetical protein